MLMKTRWRPCCGWGLFTLRSRKTPQLHIARPSRDGEGMGSSSHVLLQGEGQLYPFDTRGTGDVRVEDRSWRGTRKGHEPRMHGAPEAREAGRHVLPQVLQTCQENECAPRYAITLVVICYSSSNGFREALNLTFTRSSPGRQI